ncbi:hypothetical protein [Campylobacter sp.]|uniref:hypothetical protein n=1 Tax=Campylobacter sp. TaxID=205 RepID=UPI003FA13345
MRKFLAILIFALPLWAGNLLEIIALAQSAKLESLKEFNKNDYINANKSKKLNLSLDGRYTFIPDELKGGYMTKAGSITAKVEYLIFDGGASEAADKILDHKGVAKIYKDEELMNLTAFQVAKVYFNAIALNSLINLETKFTDAFAKAASENEFWFEYGWIDKAEFDAINFTLDKKRAELDELGLKLAELNSRINLLSNGEIGFNPGSKIMMPDFSKDEFSAKLGAMEQEKYIKEQENEKQKSKFAPKIYLKDTQSVNNNSFKKGEKTAAQMAEAYADANKPRVEFEWKLPDSLSLSKQSQAKRIEEQKAALDLSDEENRIIARLKDIKATIESLSARLNLESLKQDKLDSGFNDLLSSYLDGEIKYEEFLFVSEKNFSDRANFILDGDLLELNKLEYFFECTRKINEVVIE